MNEHVQAYQRAQREVEILRQRSEERHEEVSVANPGNKWASSDDETHRRLLAQYIAAFWKWQLMSAPIMVDNLQRFGVPNMTVDVMLIHNKMGAPYATNHGAITDVCAKTARAWANEIGLPDCDVSPYLEVSKDGEYIGYIGPEAFFCYEQAPDLATAIRWKVLTDVGRTRIVESLDAEAMAEEILDVIREHGTSEECFRGPFMEVLAKLFVKDDTTMWESRDGGNSLWCAATRELGCYHRGYNYHE